MDSDKENSQIDWSTITPQKLLGGSPSKSKFDPKNESQAGQPSRPDFKFTFPGQQVDRLPSSNFPITPIQNQLNLQDENNYRSQSHFKQSGWIGDKKNIKHDNFMKQKHEEKIKQGSRNRFNLLSNAKIVKSPSKKKKPAQSPKDIPKKPTENVKKPEEKDKGTKTKIPPSTPWFQSQPNGPNQPIIPPEQNQTQPDQAIVPPTEQQKEQEEFDILKKVPSEVIPRHTLTQNLNDEILKKLQDWERVDDFKTEMRVIPADGEFVPIRETERPAPVGSEEVYALIDQSDNKILDQEDDHMVGLAGLTGKRPQFYFMKWENMPGLERFFEDGDSISEMVKRMRKKHIMHEEDGSRRNLRNNFSFQSIIDRVKNDPIKSRDTMDTSIAKKMADHYDKDLGFNKDFRRILKNEENKDKIEPTPFKKEKSIEIEQVSSFVSMKLNQNQYPVGLPGLTDCFDVLSSMPVEQMPIISEIQENVNKETDHLYQMLSDDKIQFYEDQQQIMDYNVQNLRNYQADNEDLYESVDGYKGQAERVNLNIQRDQTEIQEERMSIQFSDQVSEQELSQIKEAEEVQKNLPIGNKLMSPIDEENSNIIESMFHEKPKKQSLMNQSFNEKLSKEEFEEKWDENLYQQNRTMGELSFSINRNDDYEPLYSEKSFEINFHPPILFGSENALVSQVNEPRKVKFYNRYIKQYMQEHYKGQHYSVTTDFLVALAIAVETVLIPFIAHSYYVHLEESRIPYKGLIDPYEELNPHLVEIMQSRKEWQKVFYTPGYCQLSYELTKKVLDHQDLPQYHENIDCWRNYVKSIIS